VSDEIAVDVVRATGEVRLIGWPTALDAIAMIQSGRFTDMALWAIIRVVGAPSA
jgi:hypothetical protein